jgi:hypothetical protein
MIRKGGFFSRWAIDYLALVSDTTIDDYIGRFRHGTPADKEAFHLARLGVFNAVDALDGTVASLVILEEREMERAASTSVIWCEYKTDRSSFKDSFLLSEFFLHCCCQISCQRTWRDLSWYP